jgi:hypothetical protein
MSEHGGFQHARSWWAQHARVWTQYVRTCGARMSELGGALVPPPSGSDVAVAHTGFTRCPTCQLCVEVSLGQIGGLKAQDQFIQVETRYVEEINRPMVACLTCDCHLFVKLLWTYVGLSSMHTSLVL